MSETIISAVLKFFGQKGRLAWWRKHIDLGDVIAVIPFHSGITVKVSIQNHADLAAANLSAIVDFEDKQKREARAWILPQTSDQRRDVVPVGLSELVVDWKPSQNDGAVSSIRIWVEGVEMPVSDEGIEKIRTEIAARLSP